MIEYAVNSLERSVRWTSMSDGFMEGSTTDPGHRLSLYLSSLHVRCRTIWHHAIDGGQDQ